MFSSSFCSDVQGEGTLMPFDEERVETTTSGDLNWHRVQVWMTRHAFSDLGRHSLEATELKTSSKCMRWSRRQRPWSHCLGAGSLKYRWESWWVVQNTKEDWKKKGAVSVYRATKDPQNFWQFSTTCSFSHVNDPVLDPNKNCIQ